MTAPSQWLARSLPRTVSAWRLGVRASAPKRACLEYTSMLVSDYKEMTRVLSVDLAVSPDGGWRVGRAEGELLEDLLLQSPTLIDGKEITVLVVRINSAVRVYGHGVDTPLKAVRMIINARHVTRGVAAATQRIRVLKSPLDAHR